MTCSSGLLRFIVSHTSFDLQAAKQMDGISAFCLPDFIVAALHCATQTCVCCSLLRTHQEIMAVPAAGTAAQTQFIDHTILQQPISSAVAGKQPAMPPQAVDLKSTQAHADTSMVSQAGDSLYTGSTV